MKNKHSTITKQGVLLVSILALSAVELLAQTPTPTPTHQAREQALGCKP